MSECINSCYTQKELHLFEHASLKSKKSREDLCAQYKAIWCECVALARHLTICVTGKKSI
jgi:hypothetical protein